MIRTFLIYSLLVLPALSFAHGDEDHGDSAKPAELTSLTPRAEAQTELFELVVTSQNGQLTIYLDDFGKNQPISGAKVDIESGTWKAVAHAADSGVYRVTAPHFAAPGAYPLVFTVTAGEAADLIETTLVVGDSAQASTPDKLPSRSFFGWLSASLIALVVVAAGLLKRHKSAQKVKTA